MDTEFTRFPHQAPEVGIQLWRTAGQVHGVDVALAQRANYVLHDLCADVHIGPSLVRPGVHVAMPAGLVAQLAEVHLQRRDLHGSQRVEAVGAQLLVETVDHQIISSAWRIGQEAARR